VFYLFEAINNTKLSIYTKTARMNFPKTKTINQKNMSQAKGATLSDFQIFDLSQDIDESKNLAETNPSKLKELQNTMEIQYRELVNDSYIWK
jgi:arylsulfatase A